MLWQPGTDHAGIATQMMVERKLASENRTDRRTMGREAFLKEVWAWKEESGGTIINQLKRLGASCDWSRERFTMDPGLSEAVRAQVFVELHRQGLIYKDRRLVNWDPKLLTAISDLEVDQREVKGHMWYFRYPLEGVAFDPENEDTFITIATTRPETMLGDGAVAVHPQNEKIGWKIGKVAILPLVNRRLPIIADEYADPEKGTGAVKITAAHDFNDYEVYKRHSSVVPLINLMTADARMVDEPHMPEQYRGLDRYECRKRVVADLEAMNLVAKIEPHTHMVPHGDRSGVVIEPWLTEQWYVDVKPLADKAMAAVRDGRTKMHPPERAKIFFNWLENIEPWCISRQLWWGHQIPAWYGPDKHVFVAGTEEEAQAAADKHYGRVVPLARDPDVLDTWFSSALWPYSTLGWPQKTPELAKFYPNDVLVTAADILFFWVARMMMTGIHFMEDVPFRDVILHGIVRDEKGKKMSKTTGNVVDPLTVIDQYGADALRFTLAAMTMQGRDIKLAMSRVEGYRNFATKVWNAARFAEVNGCAYRGLRPGDAQVVAEPLGRRRGGGGVGGDRGGDRGLPLQRGGGRGLSLRLGHLLRLVCRAVEAGAAGRRRSGEDRDAGHRRFLIDVICKILHPFMPYLTEELWAAKADVGAPRPPQRDGDTLLCLADWPDFGGFSAPDAQAELGFVVGLVSEIRSVRAEMNVPAAPWCRSSSSRLRTRRRRASTAGARR